ncbi:MAG: protein kinase [Gammaproteobacteria bacterium]|nr:protein kinase [Gammaproteobacteria bacterium]
MRTTVDFSEYDGGPSFKFQEKIFYRSGKKLGSGTFGDVFRFKSDDESQLCLKSEIMHYGKYSAGLDFKKEADWYHKIYGLGVFSGNPYDKTTPHYILMPFFEGKTLHDIAYQSVKEVFYHWIKTADAINQLHEKYNAVHCDLKADNVMFGKYSDLNLKNAQRENAFVIDFGWLSPVGAIRLDHFHDTLYCKTQFYHQPPEVFTRYRNVIKADPTHDIYSLGVLLGDMFRLFFSRKEQDGAFVNAKEIALTVKDNLAHQDHRQRWSIAKAIYILGITFFSRIPRELFINKMDDVYLGKAHCDDLLAIVWHEIASIALRAQVTILQAELEKRKSKQKEQKVKGLNLLESEMKIKNPEFFGKAISDVKVKCPELTAGFFSRRTKVLLAEMLAVTPVFY